MVLKSSTVPDPTWHLFDWLDRCPLAVEQADHALWLRHHGREHRAWLVRSERAA